MSFIATIDVLALMIEFYRTNGSLYQSIRAGES